VPVPLTLVPVHPSEAHGAFSSSWEASSIKRFLCCLVPLGLFPGLAKADYVFTTLNGFDASGINDYIVFISMYNKTICSWSAMALLCHRFSRCFSNLRRSCFVPSNGEVA
jgi:hypothetical protein